MGVSARIARRQGLCTVLAAAAFAWASTHATMTTTVALPVEVVGEDGTTASVVIDLPAPRARDIRSLWMRIHGLSYADMVSVQVNRSAWLSLNNDTVVVAEPGNSYGGIGGGFSTLTVTLALPAGTVVDGANTLRFRFNKSDGVASGFRIVAFNLLTADSGKALNADAFTQDDPDAWAPPLADPDSIRAGEALWLNAPLRANSLPNAPPIRARCADCHTRDGRDLKYFAFSNDSIVARSRFHGLSDVQGRQIASYVRSRPVPSPGRPWNPPYQPGPGLDSQPVANWAAGAGFSWALGGDNATLPFLLAARGEDAARAVTDADGTLPDWNTLVPRITRSVFHPDGNLNPREVPISLQLPDWNRWLPQVHPLDAWGTAFQQSEFARAPGSLRTVFRSTELTHLISSGRIVDYFDKWTGARKTLLKSQTDSRGASWSPELIRNIYSTQLWQLVKTWELTQEFSLEGRGRELFGATGESRTWFNTIPAATAPAAAGIPDGPSGMGGSALTNEYFNAAWYELQILLNSGNHRHSNRSPIDWVYMLGRVQDLYDVSHRPEPARLLITVIKAMQSADPRIGPDDIKHGWRPEQNVDPTIMVNSAWAPIFQPLPGEVKRAVTEALLAAWLDKNQRYPVGQYFRVGLSEASYAAPPKYGDLLGGKAWESASLFLAAGVDADLVKRLQKWGAAYTAAAARFQYSPNGTAGRKPAAPKKSGT